MTSAPYAHALRRYLLSAAAVLVAVTVASVLVVWWAARTEATQVAADTARSFARMVASPLRVAELQERADTPARDALDRIVSDLLAAEEVYRVKIWALGPDDTVTIIYSDLPELEGTTVRMSPDLRAAWDEDDAVVIPVPDDEAHAFEFIDGGGALEVYLPFEDVDGARAVAELYLLPRLGERMAALLSYTLPVAIGAPILLSALTFPLVLRLVRRSAAVESRRRSLAEHALAASEDERRRLAGLLHDGPIQDLAAVGFRLEQTAADYTARGGDRAAAEVRTQVRRLRHLLDDLDPADAGARDLHGAVRAVAEHMPESTAIVEVAGEDLADVDERTRAFILRCTTELLRNALRHSRASRVVVGFARDEESVLAEVVDDGVGFDPERAAPAGHHGLHLVRAAIEEAGGHWSVESDGHGTRIRFGVPQPFPAEK